MQLTKLIKTQRSKPRSKRYRIVLKKKKKKVIRSSKNINGLARKGKLNRLHKPQGNSGSTKMKSKI